MKRNTVSQQNLSAILKFTKTINLQISVRSAIVPALKFAVRIFKVILKR